MAAKVRDILSLYSKNEDLIAIGAYKSGTNPKLDQAIQKIDQINSFLKQQTDESFTYEEIIEHLHKILG